MRFHIKAYRPGHALMSMTVLADSAEDATRQVQGRGYDIVALRAAGRWTLSQRVEPAFDLLLFSQELRSLLDAGLSLIEGLGAIERKKRGDSSQRLVEDLIRLLREGKSFSAALREFPDVFPPIYRALTAASEQTGDLGGALGRFIDYRSRMNAVRERLVSAAIYPAVLVCVGGGVILFLMVYVVPRFSRIYDEFGGELPFMSRLLLDSGAVLGAYGTPLLIGLVAAAVGAVVLARKRQLGWRQLLPLLLRWRIAAAVREHYRTYLLARFYRTVGLLLQGGLPVAVALGMARELLDADMQGGLDRTLVAIRGGVAISSAMERGDLAPSVAADLLKIGEKTGDMADKMIRIADFYDQEAARWADWISRLFEPLLTLTIGLFIAFIVVLLYMPIFELAGSIQ